MPYVTVEDLPDSVRDHLPPHAQEIYLAAFNKAWRQHAGDPDIEPTVHRIAWSAVKRRYRKAGDEWVPITRSASWPFQSAQPAAGGRVSVTTKDRIRNAKSNSLHRADSTT